jgi:hypothetical protein
MSLRASVEELEAEMVRAGELARHLLPSSSRGHASEAEPLDLDAFISDFLKVLRSLLTKKVTLTFQVAAEEIWVSSEVALLEELLVNLCLHQADGMAAGGHLRLETHRVSLKGDEARPAANARTGDFICLSLACGERTEVEEKAPTAFESERQELARLVLNELAARQQGWIEDRHQGTEGNEVRVFLPAVAKPLSRCAEHPGAEGIKGGSETVLLVEDEGVLRRVVGLSLRKLGYAVLDAGRGEEAMQLWEKHASKIDLLFTDMMMPGVMTGLDLARSLKEKKDSLKVIISSGQEMR